MLAQMVAWYGSYALEFVFFLCPLKKKKSEMVRRVFSIQGLAVASFSQRTNADARRNLTTRGAMRV